MQMQGAERGLEKLNCLETLSIPPWVSKAESAFSKFSCEWQEVSGLITIKLSGLVSKGVKVN